MQADRSFLYVPATRPDRYAKAVMSGAHVVIIDLEDAVAPADKDNARQLLRAGAQELRGQCDAAGCRLLVRINARTTPWYEMDVALCKSLPLHGMVIPKPDDATAIGGLTQSRPEFDFYLLVESLLGFRNIEAISHVPGVRQMMLGAADLMLDLGITQDGEPLHHYRSLIVMHSRLAGLPAPVDGVCLGLKDDALMAAEIARARAFGFGAKLCVHPRQVEPIHQGFRPTAAEVSWAQRIMDIASPHEGAAIMVDGKLVDAPILEQARRILKAVG